MENSCESLYNTENACDTIDTEKNADKNCIQGMDIIMFKKKTRHNKSPEEKTLKCKQWLSMDGQLMNDSLFSFLCSRNLLFFPII